ncbi:MAG TPA: DUF1810 domain-containing protein [Terriglobia bacterium]|nr:DUF1810 domain-containing protein [Terriglobia bacterium]
MPETRDKDPYKLQRFVDAQDPVFADVCAELRAGRKSSHWAWFIFPQILGLGASSDSRYYAISGLDEAKAYLQHPILGPRLIECCRLVMLVHDRPIREILGEIDSMKFRSCLTLFAHATPENQPFTAALAKYFEGKEDPLTIQKL